MKKKALSLFLVLVMCLTLLPTVSMADVVQDLTPEQGTVQNEPAAEDAEQAQNEPAGDEPEQVSEDAAVAALQAMIDDLPEQVTEDNADAVTAQLAAIEDAMDAMTDEQLDKLETARYEAAVAALTQLGGGGAAPALQTADTPVTYSTAYDLYVGGVQVTSDNASSIPVQSGSASYDPDTGTLSLNNAKISKLHEFMGGDGTWCAAIFSGYGTLRTIKLTGTNSVSDSSGQGSSTPIYCNGDIVITGGGTLNVTARNFTNTSGTVRSVAFWITGDLTVDNATVKATGGLARNINSSNHAIYCYDLILKGTKVSYAETKTGENSGFLYSRATEDYRILRIVPKTGHEHYLCGEQSECAYYRNHDEESSLTTFSKWDDAANLPENGSYYLTKDITLGSTWTPTGNVKLCLNGHKISGPDGADAISVPDGIDVTITTCEGDSLAGEEAKVCHETGASGNGVNVAQGGTFTLYDGKITSNTCGVNNAGTFIMYDGSITGNNNDNGAGGVINSGNIKLYGGSITGNSSAADAPGSVLAQNGSTVTLGGSPKITGNTSGSENTACNLYLADGVLITVDTSNAFNGKAGVSVANQDILTDYDKIITISENTVSSYSYFEADNAAYETCKDGDGKLALRMVRTPVTLNYKWSLEYNGTEQTGVTEQTGYTLEGTTKAKLPGTYSVTATLEEGYKWNDGSTDPKTQTWKIVKRNAKDTDFVVTPAKATYNGLAQTPTVSLDPIFTGYGSLTVKYRTSRWDSSSEVTADQVINVGKYYILVDLEAGDNFYSTADKSIGLFEITKKDGPEAPECTFSFDGDNAGKLMGSDDTMEYSLDGGKNWADCTTDMLLDAENVTSENGIQIRVKGTDNVKEGKVQTISITEQASPTAGKTDCAGKYEKGSLTDVSADMEYKLGTDGTWTPINGSTVTGLESGTYYVRYKASGTKLASPAQELTILAYRLKTDKDIISFMIKGVAGVIDPANLTITVDLPYAVDTDIKALAPEITISPLATVNPASSDVQDFTNPVDYTVTAEDDSTKTYTVTVTVEQLKLTSVTAPEDKLLQNFYETADDVINALPATVAVVTENPNITTLPCAWTCNAEYDKTPGAENTFHWKANTNGCDENGQTVEGDVTITNRAAIRLTADEASLTTEKEYDGSHDISGIIAVNNITGIETTDVVDVKVSAVYDSEAVGARTITVTYSIEGTDAWKYLPPAQQQQVGNIKQRPVTITGLAATARDYDKDNYTVELTGGTIENVVNGEKVTIDLSSATGTIADYKVGKGKSVTVTGVKLSGDDAGNYALSAQPTGVTVDINKIAAPTDVKADYEVVYNDSDEKAVVLADFNLPADIEGAVLSAVDQAVVVNGVLDYNKPDSFRLRVGMDKGYAGSTATWHVTITSDNYADISATVTVTVIRKHPVTVKIDGPTSATYGEVITLTASQIGDNGTDGKWSWKYDSNFTLVGENDSTAVIKLQAAAAIENGTVITASYDSSGYTGSETKTITIDRRVVKVAGITADSKEYDGKINAAVNTENATFDGKLEGDSLTVTASGAFADKNVGQTKEVNLSDLILAGADAANYTIDLDGSQKTAQAEISKKEIGIASGGVTFEPKKYDRTKAAVVKDITFRDLCENESLTKDVDYTVTASFDDENAGTNKPVTVFVTMQDTTAARNYQLGDPNTTVYTYSTGADIAQGDGKDLGKENIIGRKYTDHGEYSYTPGFEGLPTGQIWKYAGSTAYTGDAALSMNNIDEDTGVLTYAVSAGNAGDKITWTISIQCNNYKTFTRTVVLTLGEKDDQDQLTVSSSDAEVTYGKELTLSCTGGSGTGDVTYEVTGGDGEAVISGNILTATKVGTVTVKAIKASDNNYKEIESDEITITINKAKPEGTPGYTKISSRGKTLGEALLTVGDITPAGTIAWDDGDSQIAEANKEYGWTFTPDDDTNYDILTGVLKPYVVSSSGGGGKVFYNVTVSKADNGKTTVSDKAASKGDTVTVTVKPDSGFVLDEIKVTDAKGNTIELTNSGNGKYTFTMPSGDVEIKASFAKETQTISFVDVSADDYFYEAVKWAAENGITGGIGNDRFDPNATCTRAQIVTFLWRAAGSPEPKSTENHFTDVASDVYYHKAVLWAVENGITLGVTPTLFDPDATCTRAHGITFLFRAIKAAAPSGSPAFSDVDANAYYANAVKWGVDNSITEGIGGGLFGSDNSCTRAQIVTFLWRLYANN